MKTKIIAFVLTVSLCGAIYTAIRYFAQRRLSTPEVRTSPQTDEQWIQAHLPNQEIIRHSSETSGATMVQTYKNSSSVVVAGPEDWLFASIAEMKMELFDQEQRSSSALTIRMCHVNVGKASWLNSYVIAEDFSTANFSVPAEKVYSLNLVGDKEWVNCSVSSDVGGEKQTSTASILDLPFESMEAAELARLSLISRGNPKLGQSLAHEDEWLNSHTPRDKVSFEVELGTGSHSIKMAHTDSFAIYAADPDTWNIVRNGDADRSVDNIATNSRGAFSFNDRCLVKYKQVDWSRAIVKQYEPSLSNNLGTHALSEAAYSLSISDPKSIECVETWPARNPSIQPKSSFLFLLFKSADDANKFLADIQSHIGK